MTTAKITKPGSRPGCRAFATHALSVIVGVVLYPIVASLIANFISPSVMNFFNPHPAPYGYTSAVPGCGQPSTTPQAGWSTAQAQVTCYPNRVQLNGTATQTPGQDIFVDPHQAFPANYDVEAQLTEIAHNSCGGILVRGHWQQATGIEFSICPKGTQTIWEITEFTLGSLQPNTPQVGAFPTPNDNVYDMTITTRGDTYELYINNILRTATQITDKEYAGTGNINLLVSPLGSADFSAFSISEVD